MNLSRFDANRLAWDKVKYPYPHTLAEAMFPDVTFAIIHGAPGKGFGVNDLVGRVPVADAEGKACNFALDFATAGKKTGDYIMTDAPVARVFFETPEEAVGYGSNLLTPCWGNPPVQLSLTVLVVEDGEMGTGDCHGKASLPWHRPRAAQFRMGVLEEGLLAKGTFVADDLPPGVDLVLPVSCFKSTRKPEPGTYAWDVFLGVVAWSEPRDTKFSWQVLQWFTWDAVQADILPHAERRAEQLMLASEDPRQLVRELKVDADEIEMAYIKIVDADTNGVLTRHPWVMHRAATLLQRRMRDLALGGGQKFLGLMALPDDSLPFGVFATRDLPRGKYLSTRYPLRYWGDLRVWENVGARDETRGVVWMSHETAAVLGGDFDGDHFQFAPVGQFPTLTKEVLSWADRPQAEILKVKDRKASPWTQGELARVMLENASSKVGLIAFLIARANIAGHLDLIPQLAQELQVSVDKFKYNLDHDEAFLDAVHQVLPGVAWLKDRAKKGVYLTRPMKVQDGEGTVGMLVQRINALWSPVKDRSRPLADFAPVLDKPAQHLMELARALNRRYGALISHARKIEDDDLRKEEMSKIFKALQDWAYRVEGAEGWLCALWHAVHTERSEGCGSLPFQAFGHVLAEWLPAMTAEPKRATIVGLEHHQWADALAELNGTHPVRFEPFLYNGMVRTLAVVDNRSVGLVSRETPVVPGIFNLNLLHKGAAVYATALSA